MAKSNNIFINTTDHIKLPNILYVIIYNENVDYERKMKKILEKYVHKFSHITTYFVTMKPMDNFHMIQQNIIYINGNESLIPGILYKTIKALQILTLNHKYDYVIRGNISTIINLNKLAKILQVNDKTNIYGSGFMHELGNIDPMYGITDFTYFGIKYASGTNIILDKISLSYLLNNENNLDYNIIDDVAIGALMRDNKTVSYINYPHFNYNSNNYKHVIFSRNKRNDRMDDVIEMKKFIDYLIEKKN